MLGCWFALTSAGSWANGNGLICLMVDRSHRCEAQAGLTWIACQEQGDSHILGKTFTVMLGTEMCRAWAQYSRSYLFLAASCWPGDDGSLKPAWYSIVRWDSGHGGKSHVYLVPAKAAGAIEETKILRGSKMKDKKIFEVRGDGKANLFRSVML